LLFNQLVKLLLQLVPHSTVWLPAPTVIVGTEPPTVNLAEVVAELPQASLAVKVTVTLPQVGALTWQLFDQVTLVQASCATAPPWFASHVLNVFWQDEEQEAD
jgi:hypothetical protein